jgi:hypothetical protein
VSAIAVGGAAAAMATPAGGGQPVQGTPGGTRLLPTVLYRLPYAVSTFSKVAPATETVVSIGTDKALKTAAGAPCNIQVEWVDWSGATVGVSGSVPLAPAFPGDGSWEFTTQVAAGVSLFPFILNVFSNLTAAFEGHANIRTDCPSTTKLLVDAEFVLAGVNPAGALSHKYKTIVVVKPSGNVGD